jgi:hypothetical protein
MAHLAKNNGIFPVAFHVFDKNIGHMGNNRRRIVHIGWIKRKMAGKMREEKGTNEARFPFTTGKNYVRLRYCRTSGHMPDGPALLWPGFGILPLLRCVTGLKLSHVETI